MSIGHRQLEMVHSDGKLVQFWVGFWDEIDEPSIQAAGSYSAQHFQTRCRLKLQFGVRLQLPESPEAVPGCILCEADAQRS